MVLRLAQHFCRMCVECRERAFNCDACSMRNSSRNAYALALGALFAGARVVNYAHMYFYARAFGIKVVSHGNFLRVRFCYVIVCTAPHTCNNAVVTYSLNTFGTFLHDLNHLLHLRHLPSIYKYMRTRAAITHIDKCKSFTSLYIMAYV